MATTTQTITNVWSEVTAVDCLFQIISSGQVYFKYSDVVPTNGDFTNSHNHTGNGIINLPAISGQPLYSTALDNQKIAITEL